MPSKVLFFTGAPRSCALEWDPSGLLEGFTIPVARFANVRDPNGCLISCSVTAMELNHASWRSIDFNRQHLTTGHSQTHEILGEYQGNAVSLSTVGSAYLDSSDANFHYQGNSLSSLGSSKEELSQYYEHSFAIHEGTASSQLLVDLSAQTTQLSSSSIIHSAVTPPRLSIPNGGQIYDLEKIPGAKYLESIQPQTVTFNLIVAVISITPFREIKTRHGASVAILELVVGDETRSGFRISFWLSSASLGLDGEGDESSIGKLLNSVRPQDILLLKNVAVTSFRGQVYGQSIRKDLTKVHLLFRNRINRTDIGGYYTLTDLEDEQEGQTQLAKASRVREWALHFVSPLKLTIGIKGKINLLKEVLPPDTQ